MRHTIDIFKNESVWIQLRKSDFAHRSCQLGITSLCPQFGTSAEVAASKQMRLDIRRRQKTPTWVHISVSQAV